MIYPSSFEEKTGFDHIRRLLRGFCLSSLGQTEVDHINFSCDPVWIEAELDLVEEMREILLFGEGFPAQNYFDLRRDLNALKIKGNWLEVEPLGDLRAVMKTIAGILQYLLKEDAPAFPGLAAMAAPVYAGEEVLDAMNRILDSQGQMRDNASPRLAEIRRELLRLQQEVESSVHRMMQTARKAGWVPEDTDITIRNGRLVIPVYASAKKKLDGLVHDRSATGQTLFIEPREIFESNNTIRELELEEKDEIHRILVEMADILRPHIPAILEAMAFLGRIDFIRAKGKLALELGSHKPLLHSEARLEWFDALHPLLYLSHKAQGKEVVPLRIRLDETQRIIIISGPNAGGKSVALKTIGLLQYMLQCGITVPLRPTSEAGIFSKLFIDIGDQQSIENDLSTYSSHLLNMKQLLAVADVETLFLIDEFGSGTEPRFGGALAEAILEGLHDRQAMGVVTTHYANLKALPEKYPTMENAAMQFDVEKITPLFLLETGRPGSSFAYEIAARIGLEEDILNAAVEKTGSEIIALDRQLQQVANDLREIEKQKASLRVADDFLAEMVDKYERRTRDIDHRKNEIIAEARREARRILENSNKLLENTIRDIRESNADKEKTRLLREKLEEEKLSIRQKEEAEQKSRQKGQKQPSNASPQLKTVPKKNGPLEAGDFVRMSGQQNTGQVLEIRGSVAEVAFGSMKLKLPIDRLELSEQKITSGGKKKAGAYSGIIQDLNDKMASFSPRIDLRGMRADEAIQALQSLVDDAILLNVPELYVLHGKGDGILRQRVREYLAGVEEVKRYADEHVERGGHGITIVSFR